MLGGSPWWTKQDESNDIYIARHDAAFGDQLMRKVGLEETRAYYVMLRQSVLSAEDQKDCDGLRGVPHPRPGQEEHPTSGQQVFSRIAISGQECDQVEDL